MVFHLLAVSLRTIVSGKSSSMSLKLSSLAGFLVLLGTSSLQAGETAGGASRQLSVIDWVIIALYAAATLVMGWYFSGRQKTVQEYFVGSGRMNPVLIGISMFATLLSTISYLSLPGEALGKGPTWMLTTLAFPLVYLVVAYGLLPVYMRHRVTSAYELLEVKLGLSVRLLGATMFLALRLVWMSLLVYLTAKALAVMMGLEPKWIPAIVVATGTIAVIYTSMGGMRAVVITDLLQTILLYGGTLVVLGMITWQLRGLSWLPTRWHENWDAQPLFSLNPATRVTVFGAILNVLIWQVCTAGGDQTSVQRFMATKDLHASRKAIGTHLTVNFIVHVTLACVGFALLAYFTARPELLPDGTTLKTHADQIFPMFIAHNLPAGISGLVVSAMFAAAMSSMDSGVNSITAVVMTDFCDRFGLSPRNEREHVFRARVLAFTIGALVVIGSSQMGRIPGNITAVTNKTANLLVTPIFCLFFFALFVPFARPLGVWAGALCGVATAVLIAFSGPIVTLLATQYGVDPRLFNAELAQVVSPATGEISYAAPDPISFQWIAPVTLVVDLAVGSIVSLLLPSAKTES